MGYRYKGSFKEEGCPFILLKNLVVLSLLKICVGLSIQHELVLVDGTGRETANPMRKELLDAICI